MKINDKQRNISLDGVTSTGKFGIDSSDAGFIFKILRDDIYSDKIKAVVREYSTNGLDAHKKSGQGTKPIFITVPTQMEPVFKIRDYGHGIPEEDIPNKFVKYGKSDKRNSAEEIGFFGLGCKAGFAYGDSFTVRTFNKGFETAFLAQIGGDGVGDIIRLYQKPTKETGLEIEIAVADRDVQTFREKIRVICKYFPVKPLFSVPLDIESYKKGQEISKGVYKKPQSFGESSVILGGVSYPIELQKMFEGIDYTEDMKNLFHKFFARNLVDVEFDISTHPLKMNPSREALDYINVTKINFKHRIKEIIEELKKVEADKFQKAQTALEAYGVWNDSSFLDKDAVWNGIKFSDMSSQVPLPYDSKCYFKEDNGELKACTLNTSSRWNCYRKDSVMLADLIKKSTCFILKPDGTKGQMLTRARHLIQEEGFHKVIFINEILKKVESAAKSFPEVFFKFADVKEKKVPRSGGGGGPRNKITTKYQIARDTSEYRSFATDQDWSYKWAEVSEADLPLNKVYIEICRHKPVKYSGIKVHHMLQAFAYIGLNIELIGVKTAQLKDIPSSFIEISDFLNSKKDDIKSKIKDKKAMSKKILIHKHDRKVLEYGGFDDNYAINQWGDQGDWEYKKDSLDKHASLVGLDLKKEVEKIATQVVENIKKTLDSEPILEYIDWSKVNKTELLKKTVERKV
tara:strand:+ start:6455 stop:8509 length:2055 start_codon:yes stop_codon:yes gene_type:complete